MCPASAERVSELLYNWGHGDQSAREELIPLVYVELRRISRPDFSQKRFDHMVQSGGLFPAISPATVKRECAMARTRLQREMKRKEAGK
jgi:hypothetical protein